MRKMPHAFLMKKLVKNTFKYLIKIILAGLTIEVASLNAYAQDLNMTLSSDDGGKVIQVLAENEDCTAPCATDAKQQNLVSLFAVPNSGYQFQGWSEPCAETIGPLCTLAWGKHTHVQASFVKASQTATETKVLLLISGSADSHSGWNDLIAQRFNNQCPVIYGGVVLGTDSVNPNNQVYCYQLRLGYYAFANPNLLTAHSGSAVNLNEMSNEIRAGFLGLRSRHQHMNMTLITENFATFAAIHALAQNDLPELTVTGFIGLHQKDSINLLSQRGVDSSISQGGQYMPAVFHIQAQPQQVQAIETLLDQLPDVWWQNR